MCVRVCLCTRVVNVSLLNWTQKKQRYIEQLECATATASNTNEQKYVKHKRFVQPTHKRIEIQNVSKNFNNNFSTSIRKLVDTIVVRCADDHSRKKKKIKSPIKTNGEQNPNVTKTNVKTWNENINQHKVRNIKRIVQLFWRFNK